jgi:ABC-type polysaccharide/polyol phosphate export permease
VIVKSIGYARDILHSRRLILDLTSREFRSRHLGSALGLLWAFIHPALLMTIYYLVFNYALNAGPIVYKQTDHPDMKVPFLVWLLAGMVPWFIISDTIAGGASAITDNRFLVKKVVFRVSLLPIVRLLSNLPVHFFLLLVVTGICWKYGYVPSWYTLQSLYYLFALLVLGLGWSLLMAAIVPFLKDIGQIVQVILTFAFWGTPLIWNIETHEKYKLEAYLNPVCYVVQGYRESLIYRQGFWHHPPITAYFWTFTLSLLIIGGLVFSRLRAHFADVL